MGTAVGGGLVAAAAGFSALGPMPAGPGLKSLSPSEMTTLRAICDALFPAGPIGISAQDARVAEQVDAHLSHFYDRERHLSRLMLRLMEQRARLDAGMRPFSQLSDVERVTLMQKWEAAPDLWALGVGAIRLLAAMFYLQDPRVQTALGWGIGCDPFPSSEKPS